LSALAVPVAIAIGATASAPAMVASPNVLRMFFTSILSPSAHHHHPRGHAGAVACTQARELGRTVSVRCGSRRPEMPRREQGPAGAGKRKPTYHFLYAPTA